MRCFKVSKVCLVALTKLSHIIRHVLSTRMRSLPRTKSTYFVVTYIRDTNKLNKGRAAAAKRNNDNGQFSFSRKSAVLHRR